MTCFAYNYILQCSSCSYKFAVFFFAQIIFQERVTSLRQVEYDRRRVERENQIQQMLLTRKQDREAMRKTMFFVQNEEEKQRKMEEEEEAHKREGIFLFRNDDMIMLDYLSEGWFNFAFTDAFPKFIPEIFH